MRSGFRLPALVAAAVALMILAGCGEGDVTKPGRVRDLNFFFSADALIFDGRVKVGDTAGEPDTRLLAWTAPGDDGFEGQAALYDLRYLKATDLERLGVSDPERAMIDHWDKARQIYGEPYPRKGGELEQLLLPRMSPGDTLWFALRAVSKVARESKISNLAGPFRAPWLQLPLRPEPGMTALDYGLQVRGAGDVDNDEHTDFLIASPGQGTVTLTRGQKTRDLIRHQKNINGIPVLTMLPELVPTMTIIGDPADEFGASISGGHRLNDDKRSDFAVGAPGFDPGSAVNAGAVFVFYGRKDMPETLDASLADVILYGEAGDRFGEALARGLDLVRDGFGELLVGAPDAFGTAGAVYVFRGKHLASGPASSAVLVIKGEAPGDRFGEVIANIGDVNGDGIPDFAVGAPGRSEGGLADAGAVYVFYGGDAGVAEFTTNRASHLTLDLSATPADVTIRGSAAGRRFGSAITAGGNLAGDQNGTTDFAVSGGDTVYIFFGGLDRPLSFPFSGSAVEGEDGHASVQLAGAPGEDFGFAIAGVGDLDGDGVDDLAVCAPGADACYLFRGRIVAGSQPAWTLLGPAGSGFGTSVAATGDSNRDGSPDLLIGAPLLGEAYFTF